MHGIQTWVALPVAEEECAPSFEHHPAATLPQLERNGVNLRVIAGSAFGETASTTTFSPTLYVAAQFSANSAVTLDTEHEERGVYLLEGDLTIDGDTDLAIDHIKATLALDPGYDDARLDLIEWLLAADRTDKARDEDKLLSPKTTQGIDARYNALKTELDAADAGWEPSLYPQTP